MAQQRTTPERARRLGEVVWSLTAPRRVSLRRVATSVLALALTFGLVAALIGALGANPGTAFRALWDGALGNKFNFGQTVMITTMLALTGLAAAIPFSAHLWNIGGEGQLYFGAFASAAVGLTVTPSLPHWLFAPICVVTGIVAGAAWGVIPGLLKATINANEVIVSLMLVFVAILLATYAITGIWPQGFASQTRNLPESATLPRIWTGTLIDLGAVLAVVAVVVAWVVMARSKLGFEIRAIGLNANAARMNGMRIGRVTVLAFAIGGAFAGLAGAINVLGMNGALIDGFSSNWGFVGIAVALLARLAPAWIIPSAFFFAVLSVGSNGLNVRTGLSPSVAEIIVATFIILLLAFRVLRLRYAEAVA